MRCCLSLLLALAPLSAHAARPPAVVPDDPAALIERLPRGYAALMPTGGGIPIMAQVEQLLATAARSGDTRLAARADRLLRQIPAENTSAVVIRARVFSAQHKHDFATALRFLDGLIARDPRDGDARLSRAQIHLVQGHLDRARADCVALALSVDADRGLLCIAALSLRNGSLGTAGELTDRWLANPAADAQLRRHVLVMRGEIATRAGTADADGFFRQALALGADDVRTLGAYARHLRSKGRHRDALQVLDNAPTSDSLQLQRALAAQASGSPRAAKLIAAQGQRYAIARAAGGEPELREEAEFRLILRNDAVGALALALRNFETQRDIEDVEILRRAARAANRPEALGPLQRWAKSQQLVLAPLPGERE